MLYKALHRQSESKGMSKARRLYVLIAVSTPLAVSSVAVAWTQGNVAGIIVWGATSAYWTIKLLRLAQQSSILHTTEDELQTAHKTSRHRYHYAKRLFAGSMSIAAIIGLLVRFLFPIPLDVILFLLWLLTIYGSEFVFVPVLTDYPFNAR